MSHKGHCFCGICVYGQLTEANVSLSYDEPVKQPVLKTTSTEAKAPIVAVTVSLDCRRWMNSVLIIWHFDKFVYSNEVQAGSLLKSHLS